MYTKMRYLLLFAVIVATIILSACQSVQGASDSSGTIPPPSTPRIAPELAQLLVPEAQESLIGNWGVEGELKYAFSDTHMTIIDDNGYPSLYLYSLENETISTEFQNYWYELVDNVLTLTPLPRSDDQIISELALEPVELEPLADDAVSPKGDSRLCGQWINDEANLSYTIQGDSVVIAVHGQPVKFSYDVKNGFLYIGTITSPVAQYTYSLSDAPDYLELTDIYKQSLTFRNAATTFAKALGPTRGPFNNAYAIAERNTAVPAHALTTTPDPNNAQTIAQATSTTRPRSNSSSSSSSSSTSSNSSTRRTNPPAKPTPTPPKTDPPAQSNPETTIEGVDIDYDAFDAAYDSTVGSETPEQIQQDGSTGGATDSGGSTDSDSSGAEEEEPEIYDDSGYDEFMEDGGGGLE